MKLPLGTTVRFLCKIEVGTEVFAERGDAGEIVGPVTKNGYFVLCDNGKKFGVGSHEIEIVEAPDYVI